MRIAFVTVEFVTEPNYHGGLSNALYRLCLSLRSLGHEPVVVVSSDRNETFRRGEIEVHRVRIAKGPIFRLLDRLTRRRLRGTLFWLFQSRRLNRALRALHDRKPFDLVQYASCAATGLFRPRGLPAVVRISSFLPWWNRAYEVPRTLDVRTVERLEEIAFRRADGLFAPSFVNARAVQAATGRPVQVLQTPFFLECRALDDGAVDDALRGTRYLLFFGTIGLVKGAGVIAAMIGELLARHPDLRFILAGKSLVHGGKSMAEIVREGAGPCRDRVLHFAEMPHERLYPIVRDAFAVVLPSRIDNFPNTCLEAMAYGKVVVGTRGASFDQILEDGETGFLCERDDPADLLRVVERVLALTDAERAGIGERARLRVHELRPEKTLPRLLDFYDAVIAGARAGAAGAAASARRKAAAESR